MYKHHTTLTRIMNFSRVQQQQKTFETTRTYS